MDQVARDCDALAAEYARHVAGELAHKPMDRAWLTQFAGEMEGRGLVADLGCGPGHVAGFRVTDNLVREPYPEVEYPSRRAYVAARA